MGVAEAYILFMLSVGLLACYELMYSTMRHLAALGRKDDILNQNKTISYLVMFCIGAVFAPLVAVIILVPKLNEIAVTAMVDIDD